MFDTGSVFGVAASFVSNESVNVVRIVVWETLLCALQSRELPLRSSPKRERNYIGRISEG